MSRDDLAAILVGVLSTISDRLKAAETDAHYLESPLSLVRSVLTEVANQLVEEGLPDD
jgi:hypothetical protein